MKRITLYFLTIICFLSCSNDDSDENKCTISNTSVTMNIDGIPRIFQVTGRGIDLTENGQYDLRIWLGHYNQEENLTYQIIVKLFLNERGENVIHEFYFSKSQNLDHIQGDLVSMSFTDTVSVNNNRCFEAEFSGSLTQNSTEIIEITDGIIQVVYEEPFD